VLAHKQIPTARVSKVDEIPFDFSRRIMSVVLDIGDRRTLIAKGAPEAIFRRCGRMELDGEIDDLDPLLLPDLVEELDHLQSQGFRVLVQGLGGRGTELGVGPDLGDEIVIVGVEPLGHLERRHGTLRALGPPGHGEVRVQAGHGRTTAEAPGHGTDHAARVEHLVVEREVVARDLLDTGLGLGPPGVRPALRGHIAHHAIDARDGERGGHTGKDNQ